MYLTHSLWKFFRKKLFEARRPVFWSVRSQKNQICPKRFLTPSPALPLEWNDTELDHLPHDTSQAVLNQHIT